MTDKQYIWIFVSIVVVIFLIFVYAYRDRIWPKDTAENNTNNNTPSQGDANVFTNISRGTCTGITKEGVKAFQASLNAAGCKDPSGNTLVADGVIGPKTLSAAQNCIIKPIIGRTFNNQ